MTKTRSYRLIAAFLSILTLVSLLGCAKKPQDEKALEALLKTVDQILDEKLTEEKAAEKIKGIAIPSDTALGYAVSKYKDGVLSALESKNTSFLKQTRESLVSLRQNKESDAYYEAFQKSLQKNEKLRDDKAFMDELDAVISDLPNYEIKRLSEERLDLGCSLRTYEIRCTQFKDTYSLSVETDNHQKVTRAKLSQKSEKNSNGNFPAFCTYVYRCMGFEIENNDFDAFYTKYDLNAEEPTNQSYTEGAYQVTSMKIRVLNESVFSVTAM